MGTVTETMYTFFQNSKTEGAYMLLFALSLVILYFTDREREKYLIVYPILMLFGVVFNPVTVWTLSRFFPLLGLYAPLCVLIPILAYVPFAMTDLVYSIRSVRTQRVAMLLLFLYISICGNFFGAFSGNTMTEANHYDDEKKRIVEYLEQNTSELVVADDELLPFIASYGRSVPLLYGYDLLHVDSDLGIIDGYDDMVHYIHSMMLFPEDNMEEIAKVAKAGGCDIIVVKNHAGAKSYAGVYRQALATDEYIVYRSIS